MIQTICEPRNIVSKEQFIHNYPGYSVALDGHVYGGPFFITTEHGPYANFNHHEEVDRTGTRSTSAQVLMTIKRGFYESYMHEKRHKINIYYNDPDQDTSLAIWLLKNHERLEGKKSEYKINRLVGIEDILDITLGTGPLNINETIEQVAWIFEPYTRGRIEGKIDVVNPEQLKNNMINIVDEISERITEHVNGSKNYMKVDQRYEALYKGDRFMIIREIGPQARLNIFEEHPIDAFVVVRQREDEKYVYSILIHPYSGFPKDKLRDELNEIEGHCGLLDCWSGGSDNISSSRGKGSNIQPEALYHIINKIQNERR
jgi:hypothetical protein